MSNDESLKETGRCAAAAIVEMVAALECDYDRLEELRDEKTALMDAAHEARADLLAFGYVGDADPEIVARHTEINTAALDANAALAAWIGESAEELTELEEVAGECESREDAETRIQEDALSVEVRADWHAVGDVPDTANGQFVILLSTGGPASRIQGELSNGEPHRAWLEVQDWGTPWALYVPKNNYKEGSDIGGMIDASWTDTLLAYARCFYFGEG